MKNETHEQFRERVSWPEIGEKIPIKFGPETDIQVVAGPCENAKQGAWYCVTHKQHFDNNMQKDTHTMRGKHKLVWLCFNHGPEIDPKWAEGDQHNG